MVTKGQKSKRKPKPSKRKLEGGKREVKLVMTLPDDLPTLYVDNVNVVHTPNDFTLSFLQARPPLFSEQSELDKMDAVEARCVARLVVTPLRMQMILQTLAANFQRWAQTNLKPEKENGNDNANKNTARPS